MFVDLEEWQQRYVRENPGWSVCTHYYTVRSRRRGMLAVRSGEMTFAFTLEHRGKTLAVNGVYDAVPVPEGIRRPSIEPAHATTRFPRYDMLVETINRLTPEYEFRLGEYRKAIARDLAAGSTHSAALSGIMDHISRGCTGFLAKPGWTSDMSSGARGHGICGESTVHFRTIRHGDSDLVTMHVSVELTGTLDAVGAALGEALVPIRRLQKPVDRKAA